MLGKALLARYAQETGEGWTDEITEVEMTDTRKDLELWKVTLRFPGHCGNPAYTSAVYFAGTFKETLIAIGEIYPHSEAVGFEKLSRVILACQGS